MKLWKSILITTAALNCCGWCLATPITVVQAADNDVAEHRSQPSQDIQLPFNDLLPPPLALELELLPPLPPTNDEHTAKEVRTATGQQTATTKPTTKATVTTSKTPKPTTTTTKTPKTTTTSIFKHTTKQSYYEKQMQHIKELHLIDEDVRVPHDYHQQEQHLRNLHAGKVGTTITTGIFTTQQQQQQQKQHPNGGQLPVVQHGQFKQQQQQEQQQQTLKSKHEQQTLKKHQQQKQLQEQVKHNINDKVDKVQQKATRPQGGSHSGIRGTSLKDSNIKQEQQQNHQHGHYQPTQYKQQQQQEQHQEISQETLDYYLSNFKHTTRRPNGALPTLTPFPRHLK